MLDFVGNTLAVGDDVVCVRPNSRSGGHLVRGSVTRLCQKTAEVEYPAYHNRDVLIRRTISPEKIVKVSA